MITHPDQVPLENNTHGWILASKPGVVKGIRVISTVGSGLLSSPARKIAIGAPASL
jgi:hypothetical protein